jgi:multiple antibiotic resistance protein
LSWRAFLETFVTLTVIMDPVGTAPLFIALTDGSSPHERRLAAVQAVLTAGGLIAGFALAGRLLLDYLHVSVESLTIAGGLLLLLVALHMLQGEGPQTGRTTNVALVPLATPLLAGPGAIATIMVLAGRHSGPAGRAGVIAGIVAAVALVGLGLVLAAQIAQFLRPALAQLFTRVLGLLLAAIAVQLIVDAVRSLLRSGAA